MAQTQIIKLIDIESMEFEIYGASMCKATVDELYEFGKIMFSESQTRSSQLDSKLVTMLGWSGATLTFLLLNHAAHDGSWKEYLVWAAATAAIVAVGIAAALRTRMWAAPSEADWFKQGLMDQPEKLRRYHVISLLLAHQETIKTVARKAHYIRWGEGCLAASSVVVFLVLLFS